MVEATSEARVDKDQGKDEDKAEKKVYTFQCLEQKENEVNAHTRFEDKMHQYVAMNNGE